MESENTDLIVRVFRHQQTRNTTLGTISVEDRNWTTLEDTLRKTKIKKVTAIPTGRYEIKLRPWGRIYQNYLKKFGKVWNVGTLWLQDVPNFQYILIHLGNTKEHTEGCILIGNAHGRDKNGDFEVYNSTDSYKEFYPIIRDAILQGRKVFIEIENDEDLRYYD